MMTETKSSSIDQHIGERLKRRREELQLSEEDIAEALKVPVDDVPHYESGRLRLGGEKLRLAAAYLQAESPLFFFQGFKPCADDTPSKPEPHPDRDCPEAERLLHDLQKIDDPETLALLKAIAAYLSGRDLTNGS